MFLSFLSLLLPVLTVVQRTRNAAVPDSAVGVMQSVLTERSSEHVQQGLTGADASVSALRLDTALSDSYETSADNSVPDQCADGLLMLVTVVAQQSTSVDREKSVFGLDDSVARTLRWWPEDE